MNNKNENTKPTVLLVDDCEDTLSIMRLLFESAGGEVYTANSGAEALSFISGLKEKNKCLDMAILDIRMPNMTGDELAKQLRKEDDYCLIVALTATATAEGRNQSLDSGIDVYLGKSAIKKEVAEALVAQAKLRINIAKPV